MALPNEYGAPVASCHTTTDYLVANEARIFDGEAGDHPTQGCDPTALNIRGKHQVGKPANLSACETCAFLGSLWSLHPFHSVTVLRSRLTDPKPSLGFFEAVVNASTQFPFTAAGARS
jgi:hypothetical protein